MSFIEYREAYDPLMLHTSIVLTHVGGASRVPHMRLIARMKLRSGFAWQRRKEKLV
jgi:hypothetical protein